MGPPSTKRNPIHLLASVAVATILFGKPISQSSLSVDAAVACNVTNDHCEDALYKGSQCQDGFCTNPFQQGCLRSLLREEKYATKYEDDANALNLEMLRKRVLSSVRACNSEDAPDAAKNGICIDNLNSDTGNNFPEVRLWPQNWESAISTSWILQIMYSELLGVPATLETGVFDMNSNFYDESNRLDYGKANEYEMLQYAFDAEGGDCTIYKEFNQGASAEDYKPCAHVVPEIWYPNQNLYDKQSIDVAEQTRFGGAIGLQNWYITRFSIIRDSTLGTYFGMQGESNRQKLAETFKYPTTFKDYCTSISPTNCTSHDGVATRPPVGDGTEDWRYFISGVYDGHFRLTEKNDCNKTKECAGHFMDYPCGWTSFFQAQRYHLNFSFEAGQGTKSSKGYTYSEIVDIWYAANATKSDLIGYWYTPDGTYITFEGTDSEFVPVVLPTPTQECLDNRVDILKRCSDDASDFDIYGNSIGVCGEPSTGFKKVAVADFSTNIKNHQHPRARLSPAYEVFTDFYISELQLNEILSAWVHRGIDKHGFDLRIATCNWVADNLDYISRFIPSSHPKIFVHSSEENASAIAALIFASLTIFVIVTTTIAIADQQYRRNSNKVNKISQIEFVLLLLFGLLLVSLGSLVMALYPTNATCVSAIWMINIGYTLQLVPLIVKVKAIIELVAAARKFKRLEVSKQTLLTKSIGVTVIAAVYCLIWTILDAPRPQEDLISTETSNEYGETEVTISYYCESESNVWFIVSFIWQGLLLIGASFLAYQMRSVPNSVNDSAAIALMIYSSSIFLILRVIAWVMSVVLADSSITKSSLQHARSMMCSLDAILNMLIYFPRFFITYDNARPSVLRGFVLSRRDLNQASFLSTRRFSDDSRMLPRSEPGTLNLRVSIDSYKPVRRGSDFSEMSNPYGNGESEIEQREKPTCRPYRLTDSSKSLPDSVMEKYGLVREEQYRLTDPSKNLPDCVMEKYGLVREEKSQETEERLR